MADLPDCPRGREEEYLADMAGENGTKPANPWSRKEAYLDAIDGRMDDIETQVAALASDLSFKGSVATETDLPSGAAVGDAYITEDTGVMYVWTGTDWVALGGTGINVVQTTGTSQTDVMSQNATTSMVYADPGTRKKIQIGSYASVGGDNSIVIGANAHTGSNTTYAIAIGSVSSSWPLSTEASGTNSIAIGPGAKSWSDSSLAIGNTAKSNTYKGSIALGPYSSTSAVGEMNIGSSNTSYGYNSSNYRLLTGLYDPQTAHDAATKGYVDTLVGNIETALHAINNGGNA